MKKIISSLLCLIVAITAVITMASFANAAGVDVYQTTCKTEIYSGPSSGYKTLGHLEEKDTFVSIGVTMGKHGEWYQMDCNGTIGYVRGAYVKKVSSAQQPTKPKPDSNTPSAPSKPNPPSNNPSTPNIPASKNTYQAIQNTDIQTGPSSGYAKLGVLKKGDTFVATGTAQGKHGVWYIFDFNGKTAYVRGAHVKKYVGTQTSPSEPPAIEQPTTPPEAEQPSNPPLDTKPDVPVASKNTYQAKRLISIHKGTSSGYATIGTLKKGEAFISLGIAMGKHGEWHQLNYNGKVGYVRGSDVEKVTTLIPNPPVEDVPSTEPEINDSGYPMTYKDETCTITIYKEWYENAYVYAAHVQFSDYDRLWAECAKGKYNSGTEATSTAAKRVGAILAINGDYATPGNGAGGYAIARNGQVCNDKKAYPEGVYNSNTGILSYGQSKGIAGQQLSTLVKEGKVADTFQFGPSFLINGTIYGDKNSNSRAQRTFIGTNGVAGDIWLCVSDGRYNDGKSAGLNAYQCATYLQGKGCTLGTPLDGGGSSTIYFNGQVLNAAKNGQRAVVDFVMFK